MPASIHPSIHAHPLRPPSLAQPDGIEAASRPLSRRDAGAFLRAARRFCRPERLADAAAEARGALATASQPQLKSLW
jgi:chromodomain-helicase-DNA-binding protein 1